MKSGSGSGIDQNTHVTGAAWWGKERTSREGSRPSRGRASEPELVARPLQLLCGPGKPRPPCLRRVLLRQSEEARAVPRQLTFCPSGFRINGMSRDICVSASLLFLSVYLFVLSLKRPGSEIPCGLKVRCWLLQMTDHFPACQRFVSFLLRARDLVFQFGTRNNCQLDGGVRARKHSRVFFKRRLPHVPFFLLGLACFLRVHLSPP